jgi:radical SAM protein with 4Fe4S-binding SPASM domain
MRTPRYLYLTITRECNLRCQQCHFWAYKDPPDRLSIEELKGVIDQFCELNPEGIVVFSGAETTVRKEEFFELSRYVSSKGMIATCVTNGYDFDEASCERMILEGPRFITVSLDSHIPEVHNRLRGKKDVFERAVKTIERLVKYRDKYPFKRAGITVIAIIYNENIESLFDYIEFVRSFGVNGVLFQILSPTFARVGEEDKFFKNHFFRDKERAKDLLDRLYRRYRDDPFVNLKRDDIEWFKAYIDNPEFLTEPFCDSHNKNIFIELTGDVVLCAHMRNLNNGRSIGNIRTQRLVDILKSDEADRMRTIMERCRKNCGLLACHRKE